MISKKRLQYVVVCTLVILVGTVYGADDSLEDLRNSLQRIETRNDICVVLGVPAQPVRSVLSEFVVDKDMIVYVQSSDPDELAAVREMADRRQSLGSRIFVEEGKLDSISLADNLAGVAFVCDSVKNSVSEKELLRVTYPGGTILVGGRQITKPHVANTDSWSHPYHGPDNNPQSTDQRARAPYMTQFLAYPMFCPMPEVSVAAGGKVFRAFGHIAHKANQNEMLNTLICTNAYNGMIIWKRLLKEGFMIHRNTMIATPEILYMADDESCKLIDTQIGQIKDEIVIAEGIADGPVWKWMAMEDGILYALIGGSEVEIHTQPSRTPGLGHWPWGMWEGHDYKGPKTNFGFGRTFVAIDPESKKTLWHHNEDSYLDSRGVCMKDGRIYFYSPENFLACLDTKTQRIAWKTSASDLLEAIGPHGQAQRPVTGYSTTTYIKCNDKHILFAGPQRSQLVVASAEDGKLLWHKKDGNLQLVLREDGFYGAGPGRTGAKYSYETGEVLARLPNRRACTRATGSIDSIFFRTPGGTVRVDAASNTAQHIAPMRPPCQDGVIISDGQLYWGPWMCGCQLSLYGHISLAPARDFDFQPALDDSRLEKGTGDITSVVDFKIREGDWPTYMGNNGRIPQTNVSIPEEIETKWTIDATTAMPTAPVVAGGVIFIGDRKGLVQAIDTDGQQKWKAHTGGAVYFPPAVARGRVYAGSADGWVYAFEAATGRRLWRFRVGPANRRIPVYGKLISTWPVAGGLLVHKGVVYAAAGIAHYDGTYVVALDAITGKVKWYNDQSGKLSEKVNSGVSLQGVLAIRKNELCFEGGGVYQIARYDLETGKCLNTPHEGLNSRFHTAFYAYFPEYAQYESVMRGYPDGKLLRYTASYEGSQHTNLALMGPILKAEQTPTDSTDRRTDRPTDRRRRQPQRKTIWQDRSGTRFKGFVITDDLLLAAGVRGGGDNFTSSLAAIRIKDGISLWCKELSAPVVKAGVAIDSEGCMIAVLENGTVMAMQ
ncbi:MAG: outer membrane protein assembly factor BamB family protein [Planctomycetota bacterium]|jgi:outer membrane protein assembly factor BamB